MKKILLVALLLASTSGFAKHDPADYPLEVQIMHVQSRSGPRSEPHGDGKGNIKGPDGTHGFDFSFECSERPRPTSGGDAYRGRWKKDNLELELLATKMGTTAQETCKLKTEVHQWVYVRNKDGVLKTITQEQLAARTASGAASNPDKE